MRKILIVNTNKDLSDQVAEIIEEQSHDTIVAVRDSVREALEFVHYELPELIIINLSDEAINMFEAVDLINEDLWLVNGGIIALHSETNEDLLLEKLSHSNVIGLVYQKHIAQRLPSTLKILMRNEHLIFQRDMPEKSVISYRGTFTIDNDPFDVNVYANLISLYLYGANLIDIDKKSAVKNALVELLLNGIEHGNCEISFEDKSAALGEGKTIFDLIDERMQDPEIARRKVTLSFHTSKDMSTFSVEDQGEGFDWKSMVNSAFDEERKRLAHGRGIVMTAQGVQNLRYNKKGNIATFDVQHQAHKTNLRPKIFQNKPENHYNAGDIVFRKGEISNFLSYIVSGTYNVLDDHGKKFATLTPNDIFIGEMAFLLGNVRTATVQADTAGTLVKLSKQEFVEVIKKFPYYGLFLARLLAQRMVKLNQGVLSSGERSIEDFIRDAQRFYREQDYKEACSQLKLADIIFPNDPRIMFLLSKYLSAAGRFEESIAIVSKYVRMRPGDANAYVIRGFSQYRLGKFEDARHSTQMALDRDPDSPDAHFNMTKILIRMGRVGEAESMLTRLKKLTPDNPKIERLARALRAVH